VADVTSTLKIIAKFSSKEFTTGVSQASSALTNLGKTGTRVSKQLGKSLDQHTGRAIKRLTAGFTGLMGASAAVGARFDREMAFMGAITNSTAEELEQLTEKAREMGRTTMFSATQSAQAMQILARTGQSAADVITNVETVLKFAGAAGTDAATSAQMLASAMAQFNITAEDSSRITDVYSVALTNSLLDINSLREAMKYAGTVGSAFGMDIEQATAAVAQFRNIGLEGSLAGTNFRMAMQAAAVTSEKKEAVMRKLGKSMKDINPEFHDFGAIINNLGETTITSTDALILFGQRAGANMFGIIQAAQEGRDNYADLLRMLDQSAGETERLYSKATANVLDQAVIVKSAFQDILLSIFDNYQEPLTRMLGTIAQAFNTVSQDIAEDAQGTENAWTRAMETIEAYFIINAPTWGDGLNNLIVAMIEVIQQFMQWLPILQEVAKVMITIFAVNRVMAFVTAVNKAAVAMGLLQASSSGAGAAGALGAFMKKGAGKGIAYNMGRLAGGLSKVALRAGVYGVAAYGAYKVGKKLWGGFKRLAGIGGGVSRNLMDATTALRRFRQEAERFEKTQETQVGNELERAQQIARLTLEDEGMYDRLSATAKRNLDRILDMTQDTAAEMVKSGKMIGVYWGDQTVIGGEWVQGIEILKDVSEVAAEAFDAVKWEEKLAAAAEEGENLYDAMNPEEVIAHMEKLSDSTAALQNYRDSLARLTLEFDDQYASVGRWLDRFARAEDFDAEKIFDIRHFTAAQKIALGIEATVDAITGAQVQIYQSQIAVLESQNNQTIRNLESNWKSALARIARQRIDQAAEAQKAESDAADAARKEWLKKWESALDALNKKRKKILEDWQDANAEFLRDSVGERKLSFQRELADLEEVFEEAMKLRREGSRKYLELQAQLEADSETLAATHALRVATDWVEIQEEAAQEIFDAKMGAQDRERAELKKTLRDMEDHFKFAFALVEDNEEQRWRVEGRYREARAAAELATQERIAEIQREAHEAEIERWNSLEMHSLNERVVLERQHQKELEEVRKENPELLSTTRLRQQDELFELEERLQLEAHKTLGQNEQARLIEIEKEWQQAEAIQDDALRAMLQAALDAEKEMLEAKLAAMKQFNDTLQALPEGMREAVLGALAPIFKYGKQVLDFFDAEVHPAVVALFDVVDEGGAVIARSISVATKTLGVFKSVAGGVKKVVDQVAGAWNKVLDAVAKYTGLNIDVLATLGEARDLMQERADLQAQISSGELEGAELAAAKSKLAGMPGSVGEAGAMKIAEQFANAASFFSDLVAGLPMILQEIATQIPSFVKTLADNIPVLLQAFASNIGIVIDAIVGSIGPILQALVAGLPNFIIAIVDQVPKILQAILDNLPMLLTFLGDAFTYVVGLLPQFINQIVAALPDIITAFFDALAKGAGAIAKALPALIQVITKALPGLVTTLIMGTTGIIEQLIYALPAFVEAVIQAIPDLIIAIIGALPMLVAAAVKLMPSLIYAVVKLVPILINEVIAFIPRVLASVWEQGKQLVGAFFGLFTDWIDNFSWGDVFSGIKQFFVDLFGGLWQMLKDMVTEILTLGKAKTKTFNPEEYEDTPGVMSAGGKGTMARFAPNDLFLAAKTPADLVAQIGNAFTGLGVGPSTAPQMSLEMVPGFVDAIGSALQVAGAGGGGGGDLRVTVVAEGKTLDDVLYTAGKRGNTPSLKKDLRRASGAKVGLFRGRFSSQS
jgi:TP901 family phage tail tape measure protein